MTQLPDQLRRLHSTRRLVVPYPMQHPLRMCSWRRGAPIRFAGRLDTEVPECWQSAIPIDCLAIDVVAPHMARLNERGFDIETINFVQHAFDQSFHCILRRAIRPKAGNAKRTTRRAE